MTTAQKPQSLRVASSIFSYVEQIKKPEGPLVALKTVFLTEIIQKDLYGEKISEQCFLEKVEQRRKKLYMAGGESVLRYILALLRIGIISGP